MVVREEGPVVLAAWEARDLKAEGKARVQAAALVDREECRPER